ncbi:MAG: imidazole glycerol phosphate synthase subunit HisH [Proteobacteria bacterium]|nr:imidazole glycerol phosphate synthase subunit HisH [Pseudomonadota bacterium]
MITIIDYGMGNIKAFADVYKKLKIPAVIAKQVEGLKNASKVILSGVGAFDNAMHRLNKSGMLKFLDEIVTHRHVPVLGICVGMQMFACSSEEGSLPGLGWIDGEVKRFNPSLKNSIRLPHMGWNNIKPIKSIGLLEGLDHDARFYFLHSYYFQCQKNENILAVTDYDGEFACVVNSGNIFGVQFHPEKSHQWGIQLLKNFAEL